MSQPSGNPRRVGHRRKLAPSRRCTRPSAERREQRRRSRVARATAFACWRQCSFLPRCSSAVVTGPAPRGAAANRPAAPPASLLTQVRCPHGWTVYPNTPIARLPRPLQPPALLVRHVMQRSRRQWTYYADGIATVHYSPFHDDAKFTSLYDQMSAEWYPGTVMDARWRMWLLTRYARYARTLPGNFAEFGVYRGGCSRMVLGTTGLDPSAGYTCSTPTPASLMTASPPESSNRGWGAPGRHVRRLRRAPAEPMGPDPRYLRGRRLRNHSAD